MKTKSIVFSSLILTLVILGAFNSIQNANTDSILVNESNNDIYRNIRYVAANTPLPDPVYPNPDGWIPSYLFYGYVKDIYNNPIPDSIIYIEGLEPYDGLPLFPDDDDGYFQVYLPVDNEYKLIATAPGYYDSSTGYLDASNYIVFHLDKIPKPPPDPLHPPGIFP